MKKIIAIAVLFLMVFALGCGKDNGNNNGNKVALKLVDYYPVLENTHYYYQGSGNEYAQYSTFVDYTLGEKFQVREDNPGTTVAKIYELKDGVLKVLMARGENYYREDYLRNTSLINASDMKEDILLKEPLEKGNSWTTVDGLKREITGIDVKVTVPYGDFKAIEVTTTEKEGVTKDYYAKDVGLVQSKFILNKDEISSSLEKVVKDTPYTAKINFYYPNLDKDKYYFVEANVPFKTNDVTRTVLELAYKSSYNTGMKDLGIGNVLTTNTKINSLYLDKNGIVNLDITKAFITEMNAGSGYEGMLLQAMVNTFGNYYMSNKVIITTDGDNYSSGHFYFKDGEYLKTDFTDSVQLN